MPRLSSTPYQMSLGRYRCLVHVKPLDALRKRVYVAPLGLWLTLDAGTFEQVAIFTQTNVVRVSLSPATAFTPNARLRVQQPAKVARMGTYAPRQKFVNERVVVQFGENFVS